MSLKPIKLFSHASGPNPWKVAMVLEELEIPYETQYMDFAVLHTPVFEKYNPNGRLVAFSSSSS
jgi:glutathione S-transferase